MKRTKTVSEKSKDIAALRLTDPSELDRLAFGGNSASQGNQFAGFFIATLEKMIKDFQLRRLLQKLERENGQTVFEKWQKTRISGFLHENNGFLERVLKSNKKELRFALNKRSGLFMQRAMVFSKICDGRGGAREPLFEEKDPGALSPARRCSFIKKTSGLNEFLRMPENFTTITMQEVENLPEYTGSDSNIEESTEKPEEFLALESEVDVEEADDYVFVFSEAESGSKVYRESLHKLKKVLCTSESIESFYPVTYLKKFGWVTSLLVISKRNVWVLKNWSFDDKQGIFDLTDTITNQNQERDKAMLITKGSNIQLLGGGRKTTYLEDSTILENPLDLSRLASSEFDMGGMVAKASPEPIRIPVEKIIEIHSKRYLLSHCALEILTTGKRILLIVGREKRERLYEELRKLVPQKPLKAPLAKESLLFTTGFKAGNPFLYETDGGMTGQYFQTLDVTNVLKMALPLWQEGTLSNFEYLMLLNEVAGRTYNDLAQYPVFPWVLKNYDDEFGKINLNSPENYRELGKPMGALVPERARAVRDFYNENVYDPPFHYGSHYSNPGIVTYYLLRLNPFGQLAMDLQGKLFWERRSFNVSKGGNSIVVTGCSPESRKPGMLSSKMMLKS